MKRYIGILAVLLLCGAVTAKAEEGTSSSGTAAVTEAQGMKAEVKADKQRVADQKQQMKQDAQAAKAEEKDLHAQIHAAQLAGDHAKVKELRAQLKTMHQENVSRRKTDKKELQDARKELRSDRKTAHKGRADRNKDGTVDEVEKEQAKKRN